MTIDRSTIWPYEDGEQGRFYYSRYDHPTGVEAEEALGEREGGKALLFPSGSGAITLPRRMWDDLRFQIEPTIAAVSTLTIVLTAALLFSAHLLRKRIDQTRSATSSAAAP